jgi:hypothetical protein
VSRVLARRRPELGARSIAGLEGYWDPAARVYRDAAERERAVEGDRVHHLPSRTSAVWLQQPAEAIQPLYRQQALLGRPAVEQVVTGKEQCHELATLLAGTFTPFTIFWVAQPATLFGAGQQTIFSLGRSTSGTPFRVFYYPAASGSTPGLVTARLSAQMRDNQGQGLVTQQGPWVDLKPRFYHARYDGHRLNLGVHGASTGWVAQQQGALTLDRAVWAAQERTSTTNYCATGFLWGERGVYSHALTDDELAVLAAHLGETYGLPYIYGHQLIWNFAPHNAFCGLTRHQGWWYVCFREATDHATTHDGKVRILRTQDYRTWEEVALLVDPGGRDLRDPHLTVTPGGHLYCNTQAWTGVSGDVQSRVYRSQNGLTWDTGIDVGAFRDWIWRVRWHESVGYGIAYSVVETLIRLYVSLDDGLTWQAQQVLYTPDSPSEGDLARLNDGSWVMVVRRNGGPGVGVLGRAPAPGGPWTFSNLQYSLDAPELVVLPDGRLWCFCRRAPANRASVVEIDPDTGIMDEVLIFPSSGDSSYHGAAWDDQAEAIRYVYYSQHGPSGRASIYAGTLVP